MFVKELFSGVNKGGFWGYLTPPPRILGVISPLPRILGVTTPPLP